MPHEAHLPENHDEILKSRVLSDAELIENGAEYENGQLMVPQGHIDKLRELHPSTAKPENIGYMVLLSDREEQLAKPLLDEKIAEENKVVLQDRITTICAKYLGLFADFVPAPHQNKRSILGNLKTDNQWKSLEPKTRKVGNLDLRYSFDVAYKPGEELNSIEQVDMGVEPANKSRSGGLSVTYQFDRGDVSEIVLEYDTDDQVFTNVFGGVMRGTGSRGMGRKEPYYENPLAKLIVEAANGDGDMSIILDGEPKIVFNTGIADANCEYRYDGVNDRFVLEGGPKLYGASTHVRPKTLSVDQFLAITTAALELTPATLLKFDS